MGFFSNLKQKLHALSVKSSMDKALLEALNQILCEFGWTLVNTRIVDLGQVEAPGSTPEHRIYQKREPVPSGMEAASKKFEYSYRTAEGASVKVEWYLKYTGLTMESGELWPFTNGAPGKKLALKDYCVMSGDSLEVTNRQQLEEQLRDMVSMFGRVADQSATGQCPGCRATITVSMRKGVGKCEYCGTKLDASNFKGPQTQQAAPPPMAAPQVYQQPAYQQPPPMMVQPQMQGTPCRGCGTPVQPGWKLCPQCGTQQSSACRGCGAPVQAGWRLCPQCGSAVT